MMMSTTMVAAVLAGAVGLIPLASPAPLQDPEPLELGEVLESALRTHPTVGAAEARRSVAAAGVRQARSSWLPTLAATGFARQHQEPMVVAPIHGFTPGSLPDFDETLFQGHATAELTLWDGGARGARIRAASSLESSADAGVRAARDAVLVEAASAYLAALTAGGVYEAEAQWVAALDEERERARLMFEEGKTPRLAVLRTEAALSRARAEREAADEGLRLALHRLARVSGLEPERVMAASLAPVTGLDAPVPDRGTLVERARASNPTLSGTAERVAAAETQVAAARASYLPSVSLSGQYSAFAAPGIDVVGEWQAGVRVSYPLFTGGARSAGVQRAEAEADAARADRRLAEHRVAEVVDRALLAYRSARARVEALTAAVAQSSEVARIEALALESGAGVQTDYLRAEAELRRARSGLAEARHAVIEARVRLAQATGTLTEGWLAEMTERAER